jgi:tetratricopeptide (TPR) repeat protein
MKSPAGLLRTARLCLVAGVVCLLSASAPVLAVPKSFGQADAAWHQGELEQAKELYEQALEKGGLEPAEVVLAYSRIGTVKAALRDSSGALSAFRVAAAIDPEFELPADSGPIAKKLYAQARKEAAEQGGERLSISIVAPDVVPARQPFTVNTSIPEGFAVLVAEVVVTVSDPLTGKRWQRKQASEPVIGFEMPAEAAVAGAKLKLKASAVDGQNNAWAVAESDLKIEGVRAVDSMDDGEVSPFEEGRKGKEEEGGSDIFKGPVPWIVAGAVIVGGIIIFAATRPADTVSIGAPRWD